MGAAGAIQGWAVNANRPPEPTGGSVDVDASCAIGILFFFQAEDGIRDLTVTGVQTCALPISYCCGAGCCCRGCRVHWVQCALPVLPRSERCGHSFCLSLLFVLGFKDVQC